jgi:5-methylthioadenosine/S-adenosylhomocysteine deaminase
VDLTEVNLAPVLDAPVHSIVPNLAYAGSGHEVKTVMVAGRMLVRAEDGGRAEVLIADEAAVQAGRGLDSATI